MTESVAPFVLAYLLGVLTVYYVPLVYADIRKWQATKKLRQRREFAIQVKAYLSYLNSPQCLDKFIAGGRNTPGWTDPEQWELLARAEDFVQGQWYKEHERAIRGFDMQLPGHQPGLTYEDDAERLREESMSRMKRLLDLLNRQGA